MIVKRPASDVTSSRVWHDKTPTYREKHAHKKRRGPESCTVFFVRSRFKHAGTYRYDIIFNVTFRARRLHYFLHVINIRNCRTVFYDYFIFRKKCPCHNGQYRVLASLNINHAPKSSVSGYHKAPHKKSPHIMNVYIPLYAGISVMLPRMSPLPQPSGLL